MILFIEDDVDDILATVTHFRRLAFTPEMVVVHDGLEAWEYLQESPALPRPLPALIMTDIKMPRLDGLELLGRLKGSSRLKDIPVVVLSSSTRESDAAAALDLGAALYLQKPFSAQGYAGLVKTLKDLLSLRGIPG